MKKATAKLQPAAPGAADLLAFIADWGHPEWIVLAAEAPIEKVSSLLAAAHSAKRVLRGVPVRAATKQDNEIAPLVAVAQCADSSWSIVLVTLCVPIRSADVQAAQDDARMLSARLKTRALVFLGEDTSGAMEYRVYRNGKETEFQQSQASTRAANQAFARLGLYWPACYPCAARGKAWLAVKSSSQSPIAADLLEFGEAPEARQAQALLTAVLKNKPADVHLLLRQGVKPTHNALHNALRKASWSGKHDIPRQLLKVMATHGIALKPSVVSDALSSGPKNPARRIQTVKLLLAAGADINGDGGEALRTAIKQESLVLLQFLLDAGADPNASKSWGSTPLHCAAHLGQVECAKLLLAAGAKPGALDDQKKTPAQWAQSYGHKELAKTLRCP